MHSRQPTILKMLSSAGCDMHETYTPPQNYDNREGYISGWNCLIFVVLHASVPQSSKELEALQLLIRAGVDPHRRDAAGCTIFDYVDDDVDEKLGSYRRELWYSVLKREHVRVDRPATTQQVAPVYIRKYTPIQCRALCHLRSWKRNTIGAQVAHVLKKFPWSQEEEEAIACGRRSRQWKESYN